MLKLGLSGLSRVVTAGTAGGLYLRAGKEACGAAAGGWGGGGGDRPLSPQPQALLSPLPHYIARLMWANKPAPATPLTHSAQQGTNSSPCLCLGAAPLKARGGVSFSVLPSVWHTHVWDVVCVYMPAPDTCAPVYVPVLSVPVSILPGLSTPASSFL